MRMLRSTSLEHGHHGGYPMKDKRMVKAALGDLRSWIAVALAVILVTGCRGPGWVRFEPQPDPARQVDIRSGPILNGAVDLERNEAEVPLLLAAVVRVEPGEPVDLIDNEFRNPYYTVIEIDFGDGSGWYDATEDSKTKWVPAGPYPSGPNPTLPDHMTQHTYTAVGDYVIRARVTFWDGEVVYANERHVRVLLAGSAS